MNILLTIHHHLDPNAGAPGVTDQLARALRSLGHSVEIVSFDDFPLPLFDLAKEHLFPVLVATHVARRRRARAVDVVDASTGDAWLWALAGRGRGPALVTRSHGLEHGSWRETFKEVRATGQRLGWRTSLAHGRFRLWQVEVSLRRADACLFLNPDDREEAVDELGVQRERAHVLPNGLREELLGVDFDPGGDPVRVAHIGHYGAAKGARYLAEALGALLATNPAMRASLLGAGCPAETVLGDFDEAVRGRLEVIPAYSREELPALLRGHQVVVSTSVAEGFPGGTLEAMACGLAPVVSSVRGTRALVRDGETGVLVPARDPQALAGAVSALVADRQRLETIRRAAWNDAQRHAWAPIARETVSLYTSAFGAR